MKSACKRMIKEFIVIKRTTVTIETRYDGQLFPTVGERLGRFRIQTQLWNFRAGTILLSL